MLEQLRYINHLNESVDFGSGGIFVNASEIHDFEWTVQRKGDRISGLRRGVQRKRLPITIACGSEAEGIAARNRLFEVAEKDVLAGKYGRVIIGDYYYQCYITKSQKKDYLYTGRMMKATLTLTTDRPYWIREERFSFFPSVSTLSAGVISDYPMVYPMDYYNNLTMTSLYNHGFAASNFRLIVYGPASNPAVHIAGHKYQVNCEVGENEHLTIDSVAKTVTLTAEDGSVVNMFNLRDRDSYIFQAIHPGENAVTWDGGFGFDIILLDERSEPPWT